MVPTIAHSQTLPLASDWPLFSSDICTGRANGSLATVEHCKEAYGLWATIENKDPAPTDSYFTATCTIVCWDILSLEVDVSSDIHYPQSDKHLIAARILNILWSLIECHNYQWKFMNL